MATSVARRRTSATRAPRRSQTEEPQTPESTTTTDVEEPGTPVDEGNPIHVDDETEENFMPPVSDELPSTVPHEAQSEAQTSTPTQAPAMSLAQKYNIASILTFADCAVQKSPDGIFDVLARNFIDNGMLSFWLNKVNYGPLTAYSKGHDLVDYIRKVSHELFKAMKDIGKPVARW